MTPKEKAKELVDSFINLYEGIQLGYVKKHWAKQSALTAVKEVIKQWEYIGSHPQDGEMIYWQKVKQEIEKL